jgi:hypothetical protein
VFSREVRRVALVGIAIVAVGVLAAIVSPTLSVRLASAGLPTGPLLAGLLVIAVAALLLSQIAIIASVGGSRPRNSIGDMVWLVLPLALVVLTGLWLWTLAPAGAA